MKKIYLGKMYNTETAKEICYWSNNWNRTDFSYLSYTLYLKKTGEFFFIKETYNGASLLLASDIADENLDDGHGGYIIDVEGFVAKNADTDTYEELFGPAEE